MTPFNSQRYVVLLNHALNLISQQTFNQVGKVKQKIIRLYKAIIVNISSLEDQLCHHYCTVRTIMYTLWRHYYTICTHAICLT